jgi:hypothetical protein
MAITSKFGFTNVTESKNSVTPVDLAIISDYALIEDEPTSCVLSNTTCPIDQGELISYKCQSLKNVSSTQDILYPNTVSAGVQYVIKVEEILSTTSDSDPSFRVDSPIVAYLTIRHSKNGNITEDMISQTVQRLLGACQKEDGTWRFGDLMRSSLKPTEN